MMLNQMPYSEPQQTTMVSAVSVEDERDADLMVNNLMYEQPKALSLATNRTYTKAYFQRAAYKGDRSTTMICDWNSGTSFVNCANSYLVLEVKTSGTGVTGAGFGSGSAVNLINEIRIKSRSGVELSRIQNVNTWSLFDSVYHRTSQNLNTVGILEGFNKDRDPTLGTFITDAQGEGTIEKFVIPISCLSTYFRPLDGQLMPPQLASGLRVELSLEDYRTALTQVLDVLGTVVTGYEITNCYFQLDQVDLTDETQRSINMDSAKDGLEWSYDRVYTTLSQLPVNQTSASVQVRKAVSQAAIAYSLVVSQADKIDLTKDSLVAKEYNTETFQYRLGSLYFPFQRIENGADGRESCMIAYETFDKLRHQFHETSVTPSDFKTKFGIMAASLERDQSLQFSGLAVNNSRTLELDCTFETVTEPQEIITFLVYCGVARAFIDNTSVAV
jgi:hypothetical protein